MGLAERLAAQISEGERWLAREVPETPNRTEELLLAIDQVKLSEDSPHLLAMIRQVDTLSIAPPFFQQGEVHGGDGYFFFDVSDAHSISA